MTFERFLSAYKRTRPFDGPPPATSDPKAAAGLAILPRGVYEDGLFTLLTRDEADAMNRLVARVFPIVAGKVDVFAADWMGRLFAVDGLSLDDRGAATVSCFDLAEPSYFATDVDFDAFHEACIVDEAEYLLNLGQYRGWLAANDPPSDGASCVGYKLPLFLGGPDALENMTMGDRSVYLHLQVELWESLGGAGLA